MNATESATVNIRIDNIVSQYSLMLLIVSVNKTFVIFLCQFELVTL